MGYEKGIVTGETIEDRDRAQLDQVRSNVAERIRQRNGITNQPPIDIDITAPISPVSGQPLVATEVTAAPIEMITAQTPLFRIVDIRARKKTQQPPERRAA